MDWDKLADVLYIKVEGISDFDIDNIDSDKYPGVIKRMNRSTNECVGFIIHDFSLIFPNDAKKSEEVIKELLIASIYKTTAADRKNCLPMSA